MTLTALTLFELISLWIIAGFGVAIIVGEFIYSVDPDNRARSEKDVLIDAVVRR